MNKKYLKLINLITVILVLGLIGCTLQKTYEEPLAPTLGISTSTLPAELGEATAAVEIPAEATAEITPEVVEPTPTSNNTTCGQTGSMTLLLIGSDTLGSSAPYGADAIRIMKADFDAQTVKIVTFPRDLQIHTASVNSASQVQQKLGMTYYEGFTAATGTALEKNAIGARVLAQVLLDNFGVQPQYYLSLQMDKFAAMIDTIGGVEVTVPAAITTEHNIKFPAGVQTLNGSMATEYARFLNPGGEAARTIRQNELLIALQKKIFTLGTLSQVPTLITQFQGSLITDLSLEQFTNLACLAATMPKENVSFSAITAPEYMVNNVPNVEKIRTFLAGFLGY